MAKTMAQTSRQREYWLPYQEKFDLFYNSQQIQVAVACVIGANFLTNIIEKEVDPTGDKHTDLFEGMIIYDNTSPRIILQLSGSNIPRAFLYTVPSVVLAVIAHFVLQAIPDETSALESFNFSGSWSASGVVLTVLLSMRTGKAYDRFWEGITLVQLMRAEWFETASNVIAFSRVAIKCHDGNAKVVGEVKKFQFTLVRLMSLMQGKALRAIGGQEEEFEVLDIQALDKASLAYLKGIETKNQDPVEVVLHWIQTLVIDAHTSDRIPVPSPILTRVYQTLSRGMVHYHNARKLADIPFPFPLSQMVYLLLVIQAFTTPILLASVFREPILAAAVTFFPLLGMWSLTFTAGELEQPFGNDPNDLPLSNIQKSYNLSLLMLLDKETHQAPSLMHEGPMTVRDLRRKHTVNTKNEVSMTDSLPAAPTSRYSIMSSVSSLMPFGRQISPQISSAAASRHKRGDGSEASADASAKHCGSIFSSDSRVPIRQISPCGSQPPIIETTCELSDDDDRKLTFTSSTADGESSPTPQLKHRSLSAEIEEIIKQLSEKEDKSRTTWSYQGSNESSKKDDHRSWSCQGSKERDKRYHREGSASSAKSQRENTDTSGSSCERDSRDRNENSEPPLQDIGVPFRRNESPNELRTRVEDHFRNEPKRDRCHALGTISLGDPASIGKTVGIPLEIFAGQASKKHNASVPSSRSEPGRCVAA